MTDPSSRDNGSGGVRARCWVALGVPALAWFGFEVGLAGALRGSCAAVGAGLGLGWGIASLLVCAGAAWVARPLGRSSDGRSIVWLGRIGSMAAAIFALAIAFQTLATLLVPSCAR